MSDLKSRLFCYKTGGPYDWPLSWKRDDALLAAWDVVQLYGGWSTHNDDWLRVFDFSSATQASVACSELKRLGFSGVLTHNKFSIPAKDDEVTKNA